MLKDGRCQIMGIVNVTPDSFYDGGSYFAFDPAFKHALQLVEEGADILDIGGDSTRPGSKATPLEEERRRVIPLIQALAKRVSVPISVDTLKVQVAKEALDVGASLINDVSGFRCPGMQALAAESQVKICVMHMLRQPETMQHNPYYEEGVLVEVMRFLEQQVAQLLHMGVKEGNIILDPGIGFGKTVEDNLVLLHNIEEIKSLGYKVLLGASRKSFMSKMIGKATAELLPTTLAVNTMALLSGVDIIRVHDVKEHRDILKMFQWMKDHGMLPSMQKTAAV